MDYDLIGDIHGHGAELRALLSALGYAPRAGAWRHPSRQAVFVGDYIDRGPEQLEVCDIVRRMVDAGSAQAVMGNHELNAIGWLTPDPQDPSTHLRPHSAKNRGQHQAFLDAVGEGSPAHREWVAWMRGLPLWLDLGGLRVIHACWSDEHVDLLAPYVGADGCLLDDAEYDVLAAGTPAFDAAEVLLKGLELQLPPGVSFHDKQGIERFETRVAWWDPGEQPLRQAAVVPRAVRPTLPITPVNIPQVYDGAAPVMVGHYWLTGRPAPLSDRVVCLDYSVAKPGGALTAYRWDGAPLHPDAFVQVPSHG